MDDSDYQSQRLDHLGIVPGVCDPIGLVEEIDLAVEPTGTMTVWTALSTIGLKQA